MNNRVGAFRDKIPEVVCCVIIISPHKISIVPSPMRADFTNEEDRPVPPHHNMIDHHVHPSVKRVINSTNGATTESLGERVCVCVVCVCFVFG
jgi:hypothetical protein